MNVASAVPTHAVKRDKDTADNATEYARTFSLREQILYYLVVTSGLFVSGVVAALAFYGYGSVELPLGDVFNYGMAALDIPFGRSLVIYEHLSRPAGMFYILTVILPFANIVVTDVYEYFGDQEMLFDGESEVRSPHFSTIPSFSYLTSIRNQAADPESLPAEDEEQVVAPTAVENEGAVLSEAMTDDVDIVLETEGAARLRRVRHTMFVPPCSTAQVSAHSSSQRAFLPRMYWLNVYSTLPLPLALCSRPAFLFRP